MSTLHQFINGVTHIVHNFFFLSYVTQRLKRWLYLLNALNPSPILLFSISCCRILVAGGLVEILTPRCSYFFLHFNFVSFLIYNHFFLFIFIILVLLPLIVMPIFLTSSIRSLSIPFVYN